MHLLLIVIAVIIVVGLLLAVLDWSDGISLQPRRRSDAEIDRMLGIPPEPMHWSERLGLVLLCSLPPVALIYWTLT